MLTKQDLVSIGQIVEEKIEVNINPLKKDVLQLKNDTFSIKKSLKRIEKKVDYMVSFLDREILKDELALSPFLW